MKKSKIFKLLISAVSLSLLLCAFAGFSASAASDAPVIVSKNVSYEGALHLYFAIPPTSSVTAENTTVKLYDANPDTDYGASLLGTYTGQLEHIEMLGGNYIVFRTGGISAKDIAKYVYAQAESDGTKGKVVRYSVAEYLYERLYVSENTDELQRELYNITLQYGMRAQAALTNKGLSAGDYGYETPIADYRYIYVDEATSVLDANGYNSGLYLPGEVLTLTYKGAEPANAWAVNYLDASGAVTTDTLTENNFTVVDAHSIITPTTASVVTPTTEYQSFDGIFKDSAYNGVELSGSAMKVYYNDNIYLDAPSNSTGVSLSVVNNPSGGNDKVLKVQKNNTTTAPILCVLPTADEDYNAIIFEADLLVNYTSGTRLEFYFRTADGKDALRFRIEGSSSYQFRDYVDGAATSTVDVSESLANKWFNLRIEQYDLADGAKTLVFINGKQLDTSAYETFGTTFKDYAKLQIIPYASVAYNLYLDDVTFRKVEKTYAEPTGAETFNAPFKDVAKENAAINDTGKVYYNNSIYADRSGSNAAIDFKFGTAIDPTNAANQVIKLHKSTADTSVTYQSNLYVNPTAADSFNAFVFEADVYVDLLDTSTANVYEFQLTNSGTLYQRIAIGVAEGGKLSTRIIGEAGGTYKPTEFDSENCWYNIKIEYYVSGRTIVYINDVKVEDTTYIYNGAAAPASLDRLVVQTWGGTMYDLYMDNLVFAKVTKTAP